MCVNNWWHMYVEAWSHTFLRTVFYSITLHVCVTTAYINYVLSYDAMPHLLSYKTCVPIRSHKVFWKHEVFELKYILNDLNLNQKKSIFGGK